MHTIQHCAVADLHQIMRDYPLFWETDVARHLLHPTLVHEFGDTAFVIKDGDTIAAYLFGFYAQTGPTAYVQMVGVHPDYRRQGLARQLYEHFIDLARRHDCTALKAITSTGNSTSIAFHTSLGMQLLGQPNADGVPVVKDYGGPGVDRVVFWMEI